MAVLLDNRDAGRSGAPHEPLVTVLMSVYNAGVYLRPSLLSIINQTYRNLDILIIDDGSTDGCFESVQDLLADPRVRVIHQENATKPVAFNRALDHLRGEFYAIQDADDISHPTRIEKQARALISKPHLAAVFCGNELIINGTFMAPVFAPKSEDVCRVEINAFRMPAHDPTGMFRTSMVGHMRYEPSLKVCETFDYILRVGEAFPMAVLGECLYAYRILPNSLTRRAPAWRQQFATEAFKRACDRRGLRFEKISEDSRSANKLSRHSLLDNNIAAHFMSSVLDLCRSNRRLLALKTGWQCACLHPADPHYCKALVYALMPPRAARRLRRAFPTISLEARK
ncbi:glycosyltransferase involved in cell wall biosynthesis [Bradyrhizobium liaoningense]|uniref:glycosyltransferase family 2 protein n=2 Tax=Nitrobacteraceae TaxID=41294 RepID=UPI000685BE3A|nr:MULTISPECIES: glycosyltransferase family 2 protein [Bradyrhizobium]